MAVSKGILAFNAFVSWRFTQIEEYILARIEGSSDKMEAFRIEAKNTWIGSTDDFQIMMNMLSLGMDGHPELLQRANLRLQANLRSYGLQLNYRTVEDSYGRGETFVFEEIRF